MKDMIARIIEMDKTARELTQRAQKDKIKSELEINIKKEEIRKEYLERARRRIAANEKTERISAQEQKQKILEKYNNLSESLTKIYKDNCDNWVNIIVKHVLGE